MTDDVRRPLSVLAVPGQELAVLVATLQSSGRVLLTTCPAAEAVARARRERPDLVLLPPGPSRRVLLSLRAQGQHVAVGSTALLAAPDPVATLAAAAARPGAGLNIGPPVSVIATVLQERTTVQELVARVGGQLAPSDELVVLDGGSTDGTYEHLLTLAASRPWLTVLQEPGTNISAGRNAAIRQARHDVLVTTDAGCAPVDGWLDALRLPFAEQERPGLVAGVPRVAAAGPLQQAQAHACYPDPDELARPTPWAAAYTRLLGTGFDPRVPFARSLGFTREAWSLAGGFPERLGWVEDGVFGMAVAEHRTCLATRHAEVSWDQRPTLGETFRMYRRYGIGAASSKDRTLVARDLTRAAAYGVAVVLAATARRRAVVPLLVGAGLYTSLPLNRAVRHGAGPRALALIPVALATKDWGKVAGAASVRRRGR